MSNRRRGEFEKQAMTERVSPRIFRAVALPAPTEREKSQMYVQCYMPHLPAAGEIVISTAAGTTASVWSA
jgi:polyphosphate kinase 2 (PPK2 family)